MQNTDFVDEPMNKEKALQRAVIAIVIIAILLLLFLARSTFSIFRNGSEINGNVPLAEWSVSLEQTGVNNSLTIIPGGTNANYTLNVKSLSEVDVVYTVVISNLPSGVEVSLDSGTFVAESNGTVTFTDAGTILYTAQNRTNSHTLTFKATTNASIVSNRTVNIDVIASQVL